MALRKHKTNVRGFGGALVDGLQRLTGLGSRIPAPAAAAPPRTLCNCPLNPASPSQPHPATTVSFHSTLTNEHSHHAAPPEFLAACNTYFTANEAMLEACAFTGDDGMFLDTPTCSSGCSKFWNNLDDSCRSYLEQNPIIQDMSGQVLSM